MKSFKLDKTVFKAQTFAEAEREKLFPEKTTIKDRLNEGWYLSAMAFSIDPFNPPELNKNMVSTRKHN